MALFPPTHKRVGLADRQRTSGPVVLSPLPISQHLHVGVDALSHTHSYYRQRDWIDYYMIYTLDMKQSGQLVTSWDSAGKGNE